jgi:hypothetical protein
MTDGDKAFFSSTANNQLDYESIRDQIEREIRHRKNQGE